jgi:DNA repair photolyase
MLAKNNIPVSVNFAPVIPGLTDEEIPAVLKAVAERGATKANYVMIRLPYNVKEMFTEWLNIHFPDKASKVLGRIKDVRGGNLYQNEFGTRMKGNGEIAKAIDNLFRIHLNKNALNNRSIHLTTEHFSRQDQDQYNLFQASP